jgi:predicted amidohydrolase
MRLCVAQTRPVTGDIRTNIEKHNVIIASAQSERADVIVFPELSLTGYEPTLASRLVCDPDDREFLVFQRTVDETNTVIGVGMPTRSGNGICISMVLFRPHQSKLIYSKRYLHRDEEPFFVTGNNLGPLTLGETKIAPAICYEISIPEHAEDAIADGANVYLASVNKSVNRIDDALQRLRDIASGYAIPVLMSNCVGFCDGTACAGRTSIWNEKGALVGQLDDRAEGILILDSVTGAVTERRVN